MSKINLENHEITIILQALATRPYKEVAALIRKTVDRTAQGGVNDGKESIYRRGPRRG